MTGGRDPAAVAIAAAFVFAVLLVLFNMLNGDHL